MAQKDLIELVPEDIAPRASLHVAEDKTPKRELPAQVTKNAARTQSTSFGAKLKEAFFYGDERSVKDIVLFDVIVPGLKNIMADIVEQSVNTLLFGGEKVVSTKKGGSYVAYNNYSSGSSQNRSRNSRDRSTTRNRGRFDFSNIYLDSRGEAEDVKGILIDLTELYGEATVADLKSLVGLDSEIAETDKAYGWHNCNNIRIVPSGRDGFKLELPRVEVLE